MTDVGLIPDFIIGACVLFAFLVAHETLDDEVQEEEERDVPAAPGEDGPQRLDDRAVAKRQGIAYRLA